MTFNAAIAQVRASHLMVRDAHEWDALARSLSTAYHGKDDELIDQLLPPFLQSWRTVSTYVLRDIFDATGITVTASEHPWGIATLTANRTSCEPLLCDAEDSVEGRAEAAVYGGLRLQTFEETMTSYATCLGRLSGEELQRELIYKPAKARNETEIPQREQAPPKQARKVVMNPAHAALLRDVEGRDKESDEGFSL